MAYVGTVDVECPDCGHQFTIGINAEEPDSPGGVRVVADELETELHGMLCGA